MKIYLIRHGETALKASGAYQGWIDEPLSEAGKKALGYGTPQGFGALTALSQKPPCGWVYVSPLRRARETASLALPYCRQVVVEDLKEMNFGDPDGFVFNMSVGYDLAGIQSPKIDAFIEGLKDASATETWHECVNWTLENLDSFSRIDEAYVRNISARISSSITESTLHGCPPEEIERIAAYLIREKGLNT